MLTIHSYRLINEYLYYTSILLVIPYLFKQYDNKSQVWGSYHMTPQAEGDTILKPVIFFVLIEQTGDNEFIIQSDMNTSGFKIKKY